ncbi:hypothetical protein LEP1GSC132_1201 [Leptospira kirschneri str. 200803703]|uniref:Uncharacterized protein n=1 Tax=Leptospira kirschneri str. 200802841 TaxID=1193047 RepID=A0A828Y985_9LEPT|nr:hypothetical protein LEP1GSC044_1145 [Leptospira kirschneri serovar Grippotyphosa str. RM52]EKO53877.1 hypothetical protein LEP1GSC131_4426 [Leptospira kirschneri str. 200802841]EKP05521.1 hypothetical protein LEP1GSC018_3875 [Leptospira kirschneri str. 2008720114]EKQ83065.1 hypothetical protein LEP1GSC064_3182 [Leptospira kirschneri serovar Grippotyphosa str. Moskva]EKR09709.1 hypothetical protein LEP1GSC122_1833 [Leptospira kirschneri serovar Valbuzzi str. 200702274]EMK01061.1 hypothetica
MQKLEYIYLKNEWVKNKIRKITSKSKKATVKEHTIDFYFYMSMGKNISRLNLPELYF